MAIKRISPIDGEEVVLVTSSSVTRTCYGCVFEHKTQECRTMDDSCLTGEENRIWVKVDNEEKDQSV